MRLVGLAGTAGEQRQVAHFPVPPGSNSQCLLAFLQEGLIVAGIAQLCRDVAPFSPANLFTKCHLALLLLTPRKGFTESGRGGRLFPTAEWTHGPH